MSNISLGNIVTAQKLFHNILTELGGFPTGKRNNIIIEILTTMNTVLRDVNEKLWQSLQPYFNYSAVLTMGKAKKCGFTVTGSLTASRLPMKRKNTMTPIA